jgi:hypothetical protein
VLRFNLADGSTVSLNLEEDMERWEKLKTDPAFHRSVRGALLVRSGSTHSLPVPTGFAGPAAFEAQLLRGAGDKVTAERLTCYVGDIQVALTVYWSSPAARVDVRRVGRRRHAPPPKKSSTVDPGASGETPSREASTGDPALPLRQR